MTAEYSVSGSLTEAPSAAPATTANEGSWDPTELNTFWSDVEILGLCIALEIMYGSTAGMGNVDGKIQTKLSEDICNRLRLLIEADNASPRFIELAESSIEIANSDQGDIGKEVDEWKLLKNGWINSDIPSCVARLQSELNVNKPFFYLPEDDGTALFCLTLVAGGIAYAEYRIGNPQYVAAILNHKKEVAPFPVASYYFLCDKYSENGVRQCLDFETEEVFTDLSDRLISYWKENGSPSLPPDDGGAHATNEWNSLLGKEPPPPPPPDIPMNEEQPKCPYDPSAPDSLFDPDSISGSDVLSKSYLFLEWMELNPSNTNGAEVFLLYMNNLAAAGYFGGPEGNALSDGLLSIKNSQGKTLVAECVDITMEQMILTGGYTAQTAAETIYDMFDDYDDPVSVAVCNEAAYQGGLDPATGEPTGTPVMNDQAVKDGGQDGIEDEWNTFMTDPATVSSIDEAQTDLMCAMIDGSNGNVYLALLAILMLLEASGILKMDAYADLSNELADETNELNQLITEWEDGSAYESPEAAEEWMNDLQDLQDDMDATPFDDATHELIDKQFNNIYDQQAMLLWNGEAEPLYIDDTGTVFVKNDNGTYSSVDYTEGHASVHDGTEPQGTLVPLTIGDQANGYTDANGNVHDSNSIGLQESFQAFQPQPVDPDNPNTGGFSSQDQEIINSLNALTSPLSQQTAAVGAEMQQTASWIELVDNTFSATLLDDSGFAGTMGSITDNIQA